MSINRYSIKHLMNSREMSHTNGRHESGSSSNGLSSHTGFTPPEGGQPPPLSDFLMQLDDYTPTLPDSVTGHYLASAGFDTSDPRILRLVSLAAQKFVSDVAGEALQHARLRGGAVGTGTAGSRKGSKERNAVMTTEDLASALGEQGVVVKKPPYFQ